MARATTKEQLQKDAVTTFDQMMTLIHHLEQEQQNITFSFDREFIEKQKESHWQRDQNVRDVLIHLFEWHQLLLNWVSANQSEDARSFLPAPYNWKTYPAMNQALWQKHQSTPYQSAKEMLCQSHQKILACLDQFSDEELFTKKYFTWTGTTSLGSYFVSVTASHYEWAMKKMKKHKNNKKI